LGRLAEHEKIEEFQSVDDSGYCSGGDVSWAHVEMAQSVLDELAREPMLLVDNVATYSLKAPADNHSAEEWDSDNEGHDQSNGNGNETPEVFFVFVLTLCQQGEDYVIDDTMIRYVNKV
jgi:hypothetical protein